VDVKYPGDKQLNVYKKLNKKQREARVSVLEHAKDRQARVMNDVWKAIKHPRSRSKQVVCVATT
jgi:hypothetical protein